MVYFSICHLGNNRKLRGFWNSHYCQQRGIAYAQHSYWLQLYQYWWGSHNYKKQIIFNSRYQVTNTWSSLGKIRTQWSHMGAIWVLWPRNRLLCRENWFVYKDITVHGLNVQCVLRAFFKTLHKGILKSQGSFHICCEHQTHVQPLQIKFSSLREINHEGNEKKLRSFLYQKYHNRRDITNCFSRHGHFQYPKDTKQKAFV